MPQMKKAGDVASSPMRAFITLARAERINQESWRSRHRWWRRKPNLADILLGMKR